MVELPNNAQAAQRNTHPGMLGDGDRPGAASAKATGEGVEQHTRLAHGLAQQHDQPRGSATLLLPLRDGVPRLQWNP
jgi:hypothetical protein